MDKNDVPTWRDHLIVWVALGLVLGGLVWLFGPAVKFERDVQECESHGYSAPECEAFLLQQQQRTGSSVYGSSGQG